LPEVRADTAQATTAAGRLQIELGRRDEARHTLERALRQWTALADEFPAERSYRDGRATCLDYLASCPAHEEDSLAFARAALAQREELVREVPTSVEHRAALAHCHLRLGSYIHEPSADQAVRAKGEEVETHYLRAAELNAALAAEQPGVPDHRWRLAGVHSNLSLLCQTTGRAEEMERYHDLAAAELERLAADDPHDYDSLLTLATLRVNWAYTQAARGQSEAALADLAKSLSALEELVRQEPTFELARKHLPRTHGTRAQVLHGLKRYDEAVAAWRRVVELSPPGERALHRLSLAEDYAQAGRHADAVREAVELAGPVPQVARDAQFVHLAQVHGLAMLALPRDASLSPDRRAELAKAYGDRAVELVGMARGASDPARWAATAAAIRGTWAFWPLLLREDFRRLLEPPEK
jgi:tetratricopeptide (TPR) repeat protein